MAKIISPDGKTSYIVRPGTSVRDAKRMFPDLSDKSFHEVKSDGSYRSMRDNEIIGPGTYKVQATETHVAGHN